jgi:hypothetical protein
MYSCSCGIINFVLLICFKNVPLCCPLGHISVYCLGCAVSMPIVFVKVKVY